MSPEQKPNTKLDGSIPDLKAQHAREALVPPLEHRDEHSIFDKFRLAMRTKLGRAAVGVGTLILAGGAYTTTRGGDKVAESPATTPDTTSSSTAKPGETQAPVENLTPEQAIGIKQTAYESVNTPEAANSSDIIERARKSISSDTPLDEAALEMGNKYNIYVLTGDEEVLAAIYGADRINGTAETAYSEVIEETILAHKHSNNRFSYFEGYKPSQIIDTETGEKVAVTEHQSFEPLTRAGDLSYKIADVHNTNFESVDRSDVFDNDLMDNPFSINKEISFRVTDKKLTIDTIRYAD